MRRRLAPLAIAGALAVVLISFLVYTQQMAAALRRDAAAFSRIYARVFQATTSSEGLTDEAVFHVLGEISRLQIPVVLTNTSGTPTSVANLPFDADLRRPEDVEKVRRYLAVMDRQNPPLEVPELDLRIHFGEPLFLRRLKWIPWLQAALLLAVLGAAAWAVRTSFRSERERIWSAMARESAHQMGTPLSSLTGWLEQLEEGARAGKGTDGPDARAERLAVEMRADVNRLLKVSRRFELIGRSSETEPVRVREIIERLERYFSARLPSLGSRISIRLELPEDDAPVLGNPTLLEWAFENLIKNGIDALAGQEGTIGIQRLAPEGNRAVFRVFDTGPGVEPEIRKRLFEIGVTTKERGWGVGLSLTRRIIEDMHGGTISLEDRDGGASFRIELPLAGDGGDAA